MALMRNLPVMGVIVLTIIISYISAAPTSINSTEISSSPICTNRVCCRSSRWTDILTFYVLNYVAHAGTTRTRPGQSILSTVLIVIFSLLFPISGVLRGVHAIESRAVFADTDLQTAARAGALCMVVHMPGSNVRGRSVLNGFTTKIHGRCKLPSGYFLMTVPRNATFTDDEVAADDSRNGIWTRMYSAVFNSVLGDVKSQQKTSTQIACSYNILKSFAAVLQAIFAGVTLFKSRGHQIDRFGYAAFGLTVVPYAVMSVINLIANLVCPEYSSMYLVSNQALVNLQHQYGLASLKGTQNKAAGQKIIQPDTGIAEQQSLGSAQANSSSSAAEDQEQSDQAQTAQNDDKDQALEISGTVGTLSLKSDQAIQTKLARMISYYTNTTETIKPVDLNISTERFVLAFPAILLIDAAVIGIIGGLSHFHPGSSTLAERIWIMTWLSLGLIFVVSPVDVEEGREVLNQGSSVQAPSWKSILSDIAFFIACSVPAIGGFVVVGQMIRSYGICSYV